MAIILARPWCRFSSEACCLSSQVHLEADITGTRGRIWAAPASAPRFSHREHETISQSRGTKKGPLRPPFGQLLLTRNLARPHPLLTFSLPHPLHGLLPLRGAAALLELRLLRTAGSEVSGSFVRARTNPNTLHPLHGLLPYCCAAKLLDLRILPSACASSTLRAQV